MTLHLPHGKMDKLRKDNELVIAGTGNITCPVAMLEMYMTQTYVSLDDHTVFSSSQYVNQTKVKSLGNQSVSVCETCL